MYLFHVIYLDEFHNEYNGELNLQEVEAVVGENNVDILLNNDPGNIS